MENLKCKELKLKYIFGDIVYNVPFSKEYPNGIDYLQVLEYDMERQKYKCILFDSLAPTSSMHICYMKEDEIDFARNIDSSAESCFTHNSEPLIPNNIDERYFAVYDYDGLEQKLIRKALKQRKESEIPLK